jgi:lysophospholipase L1-like esterase
VSTRLASLAFLACIVSVVARADDPPAKAKTPVVVLIGDSIRLGYAPGVVEQFKGVARVISPEENGGDTKNVLEHLDEWVIRHDPAVIHINAGLHDLKTDPKTSARQVDPETYKKTLAAILHRLENETSARIIFATTTPVHDARHQAAKPFVRREADVQDYNRAALEVMKASPTVQIDDLHAAVMSLGPEKSLGPDGVHFTPEAYQSLGQTVANSIKKAVRDDQPVTREAVCRWTPVPPTIDGRLDDPSWKNATIIDRFPAYWKNADAGIPTKARLLWDNDALYFSAEMTDAELRAFGTKHNDHLWNGDVFELFFKPSKALPAYYEFQGNPNGAVFQVAFPERGAKVGDFSALPRLGVTLAVRLDGTLDTPGDVDRGWTIEGRIPWTIFSPTGGRPEPDAVWLFALCRYDYGREGTAPVTMSSAPLRFPSFHRHEDYGRLRFEGAR